MLIGRARVEAGEVVLVLGAAGGVGIACVQIAKQRGATVIAVSRSAAKLERLSRLGADHLINAESEDFSRAAWAITTKRGVDAAVHYNGGASWAALLACAGRGVAKRSTPGGANGRWPGMVATPRRVA